MLGLNVLIWLQILERIFFLSGTDSGLNSVTYNNSLTQDPLIHSQGYDYDPEGQYVHLFQGNP